VTLHRRPLEAEAVEGLEQLRLFLGRETRALVDDLDTHAIVDAAGAEGQGSTGGGVLHRIGRQVVDHLGQALGIRQGDQSVAVRHHRHLQPRRFRT
jgi:hypothetical protein